MSVDSVVAGDAITIAVVGRMDYSCAAEFWATYSDVPPQIARFDIA